MLNGIITQILHGGHHHGQPSAVSATDRKPGENLLPDVDGTLDIPAEYRPPTDPMQPGDPWQPIRAPRPLAPMFVMMAPFDNTAAYGSEPAGFMPDPTRFYKPPAAGNDYNATEPARSWFA